MKTELDTQTVNVHRFVGTIAAPQDNYWLIDGPIKQQVAKQAVSCLVTPAVGDQVVLVEMGDELFIETILTRGEKQPLVIETDTLHVRTQQSAWVAKKHQFNVEQSVTVAQDTVIASNKWQLTGHSITTHAKNIKQSATRMQIDSITMRQNHQTWFTKIAHTAYHRATTNHSYFNILNSRSTIANITVETTRHETSSMSVKD